MTARRGLLFCTAATLAVLAVGEAALAAGKAGLWQVSVTHENMAQLPPEVQAEMQAYGMQSPASGFSTHFCMTPAQAASNKPPLVPREGAACKVTNDRIVGNTYTGDILCSDPQATGHFQFVFDSAEHYSGRAEYNGTADGQPMQWATKFDGRWMKVDCGDVR